MTAITPPINSPEVDHSCSTCGRSSSLIKRKALCSFCLLKLATENNLNASEREDLISEVKLGDYELLDVLGRGGTSTVYRANSKLSDQPIALKILSPESIQREESVERFLNEARTIQALEHEHIVKMLSIEKIDGSIGIAMELMPGGTLREAINSRHSGNTRDFTPELAVQYLKQLVSALDYIHSKQLLHRDLKPENILISGDRQTIKLTDFGLARALRQADHDGNDNVEAATAPHLTETGVIFGTPDYMAPEQSILPRRETEKTDIFALGVLCFEIVTGQLPRGRFSTTTSLAKPAFRELAKHLDHFILNAINLVPDERPDSLKPLLNQLNTFGQPQNTDSNSVLTSGLESSANQNSDYSPTDNSNSSERSSIRPKWIIIILASVIAFIGIVRSMSDAVQRQQLRKNYKVAQRQGNHSEALKLAKLLIAENPEDAELRRESEVLIELVNKEQRRARATQLLSKAEANDKAEDKSEDKLQNSIELCRKAIESDETLAEAHVKLGLLLYRLAHVKRQNQRMTQYQHYLSEAEKSLRSALVHQSDSQISLFYLADIICEQARPQDRNKFSDARGFYTRGVTINPGSYYGLFCNTRLKLLNGDQEAALHFISQAIEQDQSQIRSLLVRAEIFMYRRRYQDALIDLKRAFDIKPDDPNALFLKAHVHYKQQAFERGLSLVDKALKNDRGSSYGLALKAFGMWKLDSKNRATASNICRQAIQLDDRHYLPFSVFGEILLTNVTNTEDSGNLEQAKRQLNLAIERAKYVAQTYYLLGKAHQLSLDNQAAEKYYATCLRWDANHVEALVDQGTVLKVLKRYDESIHHFNRAIKLRPHDARIIFLRAKVKWEQLSQIARANQRSIQWNSSKWKEVMLDLNESIRLNAKISDAWGRRGYLKERQIWSTIQREVGVADRDSKFRKSCQPALKDYDQAIKLDKNISTYWNGVRCLLLTKIGRFADAIKDGEKFLKDKKRRMNEENLRRRVEIAIGECKRKLEQEKP